MPEFVLEDEPAGFARIKVVGVGGGGCNAVDSMFDLGLQNVEFYVVNSDLQALKRSKCPNRIQIGAETTKGRGCGADPRLGEQCMLDARELMTDTLRGADIVFVTSGLGGGTGTGAAPVVAQIAREMGILTVSIVTKPFKFEGPRRTKSAMGGLEKIREASDTVVVINNERLLDVVGPKVPMRDAFAAADKVLCQAVMSISDLVTTPGLINVDFNDIRTIMGGRGGAVMGVGLGKGESRATEAVKKATNSPLLDKVVIDGATGVLICITGGPDMTLAEVSEATELVAAAADPDAEIIFGAVVDETMTESMRVTLIATGFNDELHRKRELEEAFRKAPVAPASQRTVAARPAAAPVAAMPSAHEFLDVMEESGVFNDSAPVAEIPHPPAAVPAPPSSTRIRVGEPARPVIPQETAQAPAAPAAPSSGTQRKPTLRESLANLMQSSDSVDAIDTGHKPGNGNHTSDSKPAIRVANSRPAPNGGIVRPVEPAEEPRNRRAESNEPAPQVPQFTPAGKNDEPEADYDTPAFLRRRRSLFD